MSTKKKLQLTKECSATSSLQKAIKLKVQEHNFKSAMNIT
jgi:hypothetical protein